jgi:hypothetical protein
MGAIKNLSGGMRGGEKLEIRWVFCPTGYGKWHGGLLVIVNHKGYW